MDERRQRFLRRFREAPASFLVWKAQDLVKRRAWTVAYRLNATTTGSRILQQLPAPKTTNSALRDNSEGALAVARLVAERSPEQSRDLIARAERALRGQISILGFGELSLGRPIDWHRDHTTGFQWPVAAAFDLDFVARGQACDVKVPWEINRLQFIPWLSQAALLTQDRRFTDGIAEMLTSWAASNPPGIGVAWTCPMEVAIRAQNIAFVAESCGAHLASPIRSLLRTLLRAHAGFLQRHPEISDVSGNHYLFDLSGLVHSGIALSAAALPSWLPDAIALFTEELSQQVHPDGTHIEHSTGYHRLVTEAVLSTAIQLRHAGFEDVPGLSENASRMIEFLIAIKNSDGTIPLIGDSDSGQTTILGTHDPNDVRPLLALGALWLKREDFKEAAGFLPADTIWKWGATAWRDWDQLGSRAGHAKPRHFSDGGFVVLPEGSSRALARCGKPGLRGRAPHDHCDLTSFVLELGGEQVVIDPGSSTYTGSPATRGDEISGATHNLVIVNNMPPAPLVEGSVTTCVSPDFVGTVLGIQDRDSPYDICMTHNGMRNIPEISGYHRSLQLFPESRFVCVDDFRGSGESNAEMRFLLAPQWTISAQKPRYIEFTNMVGGGLRLSILQGWEHLEIGSGRFSLHYGSRRQTTEVRLGARMAFPITLSVEFRHYQLETAKGGSGTDA